MKDLAENQGSRINLALTLLIIAGFFVGFGVYFRTAAKFFDYWVDDAGISFTFVRNIAEGYGSVAYPGGERVEGFSNPTWVALLVVMYKLGGEPFAWSQKLGFIFGIGALALICTYGFLPLSDGRRPWPAAWASLLAAINASYVIWNQSGMENSLYAFLLTLSIVLVIRESRNPDVKPWSAISLFLLALTRPEAVVHVLIAGFFLLLSDLFQYKRPHKRLFIWAGAFALLFGMYHLWHYSYFARPFPNTYYAKMEPTSWDKIKDLHDRGWRYVIEYFKTYSLKPLLYLALPAFLARRLWREALYLALTGMFILFFPIYSRGDWMDGWRFLSVFPIPLALLLGLAAFNLSELVGKLLAKQQIKLSAAITSVIVAAAWTLAPIASVVSASNGYVSTFLEKPETSVKNISRRPQWWSKIAKTLALRPEDLTMVDMDMGGTSYYWPGKIMDIGYLLDVPMATHRYTKNFRRMMDEYFFEERKPDFIHVRREWGRASTIPTNAKFPERFLLLPDDRKFGVLPNGNYVRRDLFESATPPSPALSVTPFAIGLRLMAVEIPAALRPGKSIPVFLTWTADSASLPACSFYIALAQGENPPAMKKYDPAMGWLPTSQWRPDRSVREVVYLNAPENPGRYRLFVGVEPNTEKLESRALPVEVDVDAEAAAREAKDLLEQAGSLAEQDLTSADASVGLVRKAEYILGEKAVKKEAMKIDHQRLRTYLEAAQKAYDANDPTVAADALARGWLIDARSKKLNRLGWEVADQLYKNGKKLQAEKNYKEAYAAFSAACQAQPQHAWARRHAEEVRMKRRPE